MLTIGNFCLPGRRRGCGAGVMQHVFFLALLACSEALASSSQSRFAGKPLSFLPRGGSQRSKEDLHCVMQQPRTMKNNNGKSVNGEERTSLNSGKTNLDSGLSMHTSLKKNGIERVIENDGKFVLSDAVIEAEFVAETKLPTDLGQFQLRAYRVPGAPLGQEPCVIYSREKPPFGLSGGKLAQSVPVRVHDQCLTSEVFGSRRCDCQEQLHMSLQYIKKNGGFIIYLQQEGRGIGLANKVAAYALQDGGLDTVDANLHLGFPEDMREYGVVVSILDDMKIGSIQLMTNNPRKVDRLESLGIQVDRTLPMVVPATNPYNHKYMETKRSRMNHDNLSSLLSTSSTKKVTPRNGGMAPRTTYMVFNNGTSSAANAVQMSLMVEEEEENELLAADAGVVAREDGYCLGRQSVVDAIDAVARGEMVVVVDDMNRENEGDFIMAADHCTDLDMARIIRYSSGVICIGMEGKRIEELKFPPMTTNNEDPKGTAFTVSVDASKEHGITTGISASDRAKTMQLLADPASTAADFNRPGHIFPLRAVEGGVLNRDGHTEAAVDLARLAGLNPAGVLCEIVSEENPTEMMRLPELKRFCKRHNFVMTSIVDLAQYRRDTGL